MRRKQLLKSQAGTALLLAALTIPVVSHYGLNLRGATQSGKGYQLRFEELWLSRAEMATKRGLSNHYILPKGNCHCLDCYYFRSNNICICSDYS